MTPPAKKFTAGSIEAAVWQNSISKDGRNFIKSSVTIQRSYKKTDGTWGHTDSLDVNDIPKAILALQHAYEFLLEKKTENEE